jgi:hypothetical protein
MRKLNGRHINIVFIQTFQVKRKKKKRKKKRRKMKKKMNTIMMLMSKHLVFSVTSNIG